MLQPKFLSIFSAIAASAFVMGVSPTKADIIFGNQQPAPACSGGNAEGLVCGINEVFAVGADSVTAHGFSNTPGPEAGNFNLTLKPSFAPFNHTLDETGLGTNANPPPATCSDAACEITPPHSVSVTRNGSTLITDAIIGSVNEVDNDSFNFFVQTVEGGAFTQLGGTVDFTCAGGIRILAGSGTGYVPLGCSRGPDALWCRGDSHRDRKCAADLGFDAGITSTRTGFLRASWHRASRARPSVALAPESIKKTDTSRSALAAAHRLCRTRSTG